MTIHRGLLLTLLQIPLATCFPHGARQQHNISRLLSPELDAAFQAGDVSALSSLVFAPTSALESQPASSFVALPSSSIDIFTSSVLSNIQTSLPATVDLPLPGLQTTSLTSSVADNTFTTEATSSVLTFQPSSSLVMDFSSSSSEPLPTSTFAPSSVPTWSIATSSVPTSSIAISSVPSSTAETYSVPTSTVEPYSAPTSTVVTSSAPSSTVVTSSAPTSTFVASSVSFFESEAPLASSSVAVTETLTFTSTTSCETDSNGQTILPTSFVASSSIPTYPIQTYPLQSTSSLLSTSKVSRTRSTTEVSSHPTKPTTSSILSISTRTKVAHSDTTIAIISTKTKTQQKPGKSASFSRALTTVTQVRSFTAPFGTFPPLETTTHTKKQESHSKKHKAHTKKHTSHPKNHSSMSPVFTETLTSTVSESPATTQPLTSSHSGSPALAPSPSATFTSTPLVTLETTLTISDVQTLTETTTVAPATSGSIHTGLNTVGQNTEQPFQTTVIATPKHKVKPITSGSNVISRTKTATPTAPLSGNIFVPIASGAPPGQITTNANNPVPRLGIDKNGPIDTNKFYANFFLGTRNASAWTHPYSVAWVSGQGATGSWGVSVVQIPRAQTVFGPGSPPSYFINPVGLQPMILSARELGSSTDLTMDQLQGFSCNVKLAPSTGAAPVITFPLVQGMGFFTGVYKQGTPMLQSNIFFSNLTYGGTVTGGIARYSVTLTDSTVWFIYITANSGSSIPTLTLASSGQIIGNMAFSGTVQVAKLPEGTSADKAQKIYDASAGVYPVKGSVKGSVKKNQGTYSLSWEKAGKVSKTLLMFALPHHLEGFSSSFSSSLRGLKMDTTTKGTATAVYADSWDLYQDDIPYDMDFAPWRPTTGSQTQLSSAAQQLISTVAASELSENFTEQTDLNSMYYSGKGLAKFAFTIYAANNLAHDTGTASAGLVQLKSSFARFVDNQQIYPLYYDSAWGGVVSSCTYDTGDWGCDFGNAIYNDHHFHYGYFVYTAAVIGFLDPSWLNEGSNKAWVQTLVRDYANPVEDDGYFPFQRMFDWYHGHSWAHGLSETFDGKDQESSSEDAFSSYAIKMWGKVIGDANMEARGNLQLAVAARSLQHYYLMVDANKVEPPSYLPNKASGIIFENKIDHTTYFGTNIEYIEGIHMIPINPSSALTRTKAFVSQEWDTYFSDGRTDNIDSGWLGILYANYAIVDPVAAYQFFAQSDFQPQWLDGGASRTWYLAYCAGLGGAPS